jgi:hypothetical protein
VISSLAVDTVEVNNRAVAEADNSFAANTAVALAIADSQYAVVDLAVVVDNILAAVVAANRIPTGHHLAVVALNVLL